MKHLVVVAALLSLHPSLVQAEGRGSYDYRYYDYDSRHEYLADEADRLRDELEEERWRRDRGIGLSPEEERRRAEYLADQAARLADAHRRGTRRYGIRRYPPQPNRPSGELPSPSWAHPGTNPSWSR